jgi:hypothetical protein
MTATPPAMFSPLRITAKTVRSAASAVRSLDQLVGVGTGPGFVGHR